MKVNHPLKSELCDIKTVLKDLASQEGCDGEPYDQMIEASDYIADLEKDRVNAKNYMVDLSKTILNYSSQIEKLEMKVLEYSIALSAPDEIRDLVEGYNAGLADESCKQQAKIAELESLLEQINRMSSATKPKH
jgi:hypothetical protein